MTTTTQTPKKLALRMVSDIRDSLDIGFLHGRNIDLNDVVERAQNGPPDGGDDGTIDEALWYRLRGLSDQLTGLLNVLRSFD